MALIPKNQLKEVVKQQSLKLHNYINSGNFMAVQDTMNLICRTITNNDEFINDEFINSVVKEVYGEYGGDQIVAAERGYPIDYKPLDKEKMTVTTACGSKLEIDSVKCMVPYSSELFNQYYDYLTVNKQKTLPVTITQNELRRISCGENTFNALREMILAKVTESIEAYIRDEVYCIINDPANYKQIVDLAYICDNCDGESFISALTKFALNLTINTKDYNLAGRTYDLPLKTKAWLLKSTDLASRLASRYAQGGQNASYIDIDSKFNNSFDIPQLTIADGVIMDINWLQVRKVFTELVWKYEPAYRNECGVYNLDLKIKPINFFVAVPFRLKKITQAEKDAADTLSQKIEDLEQDYTVVNQPDAENQIKTTINALNTSTDPTLTLTYTFTDYVAPTDNDTGSIKVAVAVKNSAEVTIETAHNAFVLKKK